MTERSYITNAEGNFFYQEDRALAHEWLTCTGVGDVDVPVGERAPDYCPDPLNSGQFKISGFTRGEPAAGTYSLVKPLSSVNNFLLEVDCDIVGRINWVCRGVRADPRNYEVAVLLMDSGATRKGIPAPVAQEGGEEARVNTNVDLNFSPLIMLYRLAVNRATVVNTSDAHAVHFLPSRCADRCGDARALCSWGLMGLDAGGLYGTEIKKTHDGSSWIETVEAPYVTGGATHAVLQLETVDGVRYIAFRGSAVPIEPAECSYTDDYGATAWTNVTIGTINGQYVNAVTILGAAIFAVCSDGYVYKSIDQSESWSELEDGTESGGEALNDICFYKDNTGYSVGVNNAFIYTINAGAAWYARLGPAPGVGLLSCAVNDKGHLFVTTDDARLFRSEDGGATWVEWLDLLAGTIDWIDFDENGYVGALVYNNATPRGYLYRSEDGGATWIRWTTPANDGINTGHICDANNVALVGNVHDGTTFVAMASPAV